MKRPTSVTVISWILIVMGSISLIVSTMNLNNPAAREVLSKNPIPLGIQYVMMYAAILITLVCGIAMLKRLNWARLLYVGWNIFTFIVGLVTSPAKAMMIPGIILFLILAYFLFRPKANEYFKAAGAA